MSELLNDGGKNETIDEYDNDKIHEHAKEIAEKISENKKKKIRDCKWCKGNKIEMWHMW